MGSLGVVTLTFFAERFYLELFFFLGGGGWEGGGLSITSVYCVCALVRLVISEYNKYTLNTKDKSLKNPKTFQGQYYTLTETDKVREQRA